MHPIPPNSILRRRSAFSALHEFGNSREASWVPIYTCYLSIGRDTHYSRPGPVAELHEFGHVNGAQLSVLRSASVAVCGSLKPVRGARPRGGTYPAPLCEFSRSGLLNLDLQAARGSGE